ncbi:MAG: HAMP domain-containing histidine kinase [Lachnospiraceae bacterium]|nr:HAMP domain-containing histidine kinase [Lachnospiraceae bacterium]
MIEKLQRKFVLVVMLVYVVVVLVILGIVNLLSLSQLNMKYDILLGIIAENEGSFPDVKHFNDENANFGIAYRLTEETKFETRYFHVTIDADSVADDSIDSKSIEVSEVDIEHIAIDSEEATELARQVASLGRLKGTIDTYRYLVEEDDQEVNVYFIDISSAVQNFMSFLYISLLIAFISLCLVIIVTRLVARPAMAPIIDSIEQQKRFITDASHELKTPLAIISANTDVIELMNGKSEWTDSIKNQTIQLDNLIKQLLLLDQLDSDEVKDNFVEFDLSEAILETAKSFETLAKSKKKTMKLDVLEGLTIKGDRVAISQLASIFIENATKYAKEDTEIEVILKDDGKNKILEVINEGEPIDDEELSRLFRRFYRTDTSRNRKAGGFGIGLSIAKSIVDSHNGVIEAVNLEDGRICFRAKL